MVLGAFGLMEIYLHAVYMTNQRPGTER